MKQTIVAAAVLAAFSAVPAWAQGSHDHHARPQAGMHGGQMMQMHAMHHALSGSMQFTEGRLAFLKAELKITDAQMPPWEQFASAYRAVAKAMSDSHGAMTHHGMEDRLPDVLDREEKKLAGHLDAIRTLRQGVLPLYAVLSDEQKKLADGFLHHPLGRM
jgi:hypothetical protein